MRAPTCPASAAITSSRCGAAAARRPAIRRSAVRFLLGGASPAGDVARFRRDAFSLLRGFEPNTFAGSHVALVNADYRWPIARPQRGFGTWPLFLHTIHAAVFADAGHAWTRAFNAARVKTSAGGELSADIVAGYSLPFTSRPAPHGATTAQRRTDRATVYVRIGRAF